MDLWGRVQGNIIDVIRSIDPWRTIVVGGAFFNNIDSMLALPHYNDDNLIYTFHFYEPFIFTHQGADWITPVTLTSVRGMPWPPDSGPTPQVPLDLIGNFEWQIRNYADIGSKAAVLEYIDKVVDFARERNVPVWCGEFGVFARNMPYTSPDRTRWYQFVVAAFNERSIPWTMWEYYGEFGIFTSDNWHADINTDLNADLARAMGFNHIPQIPRHVHIHSAGFSIYDDDTIPNIAFSHWGSHDHSFFDTQASDGRFAVRWGDAVQHGNIVFSFKRQVNLSQLASTNHILEFRAKASRASRFDVQFIMPENNSSTPWQMNYTVDEQLLPADGNWHTVRIPLRDMVESGAWVAATEQFHTPRGAFSWNNIQSLMFIANHGAMPGTVWFDSISLCRP
jgi:endoglucanase